MTSFQGQPSESATVVHYTNGFVHNVKCFQTAASLAAPAGKGKSKELGLSNVYYAHRAIPNVLVQEVKITNPSPKSVLLNVERLGISNWRDSVSKSKT